MKSYKSVYPIFNRALLFFTFLQLLSCQSSVNNGNTTQQTSAKSDTSATNSSIKSPQFSSGNFEVKTYEVKDSTGKSQGWGYDIYIGNNKTIHQPIIPAIPGNRSFKTENDAMKTGLFAANKMKKNASLPTLLIKELDSLGVTK